MSHLLTWEESKRLAGVDSRPVFFETLVISLTNEAALHYRDVTLLC